MMNRLLLSDVKKTIDKVDVVSFDVFDTLLLRPYARPIDLFLHLEMLEDAPGFARLRREAELTARRNLPREREDVFLSEIYNVVSPRVRSLQAREQELESRVLCQNPELKQVWDYAQQAGKRIVVTSDMYLPSSVIGEALRRNGYEGWAALYVSCEVGKSKATGHLYEHILQEQGICHPRRMLHIGDAKQADVKRPRHLGIRAVRYKPLMPRFKEAHPRMAAFQGSLPENVGVSILMGLMAIRWQRERCGVRQGSSYWSRLGYQYVGPVAYGYAAHIAQEAQQRGLTDVLFVARDGYTLQKVFDTLGSGVNSHYVYASRSINLVCRLDYDTGRPAHMQSIVQHFSEQDAELRRQAASAPLHTPEDYQSFIRSHEDRFRALATREFAQYQAYIAKCLGPNHGPVGMVDTVTARYSAQKLLEHTIGERLHGFYWGVWDNLQQGDFSYSTYVSYHKGETTGADVFTLNWNVMEFLLTAPEYPIRAIDAQGAPISYTPPPHEEMRTQCYTAMAPAALSFAEDVRQIFGGTNIYLSGAVAVAWVNAWIRNPTEDDMRHMPCIYHAMDSNHSDYEPLLVGPERWIHFLHKPRATAARVLRRLWQTPQQRFLCSLVHPVRLSVGGLKRWDITLLPHLQKRWFSMALTIGAKIRYSFTIGRRL